MTIAELFVNLGVKGTETAKGALTGVQKGLSDIGSSGLAAKAALLAVVYGAERMTMAAAGRGRDLTMFVNATKLSVMELQKWQYAAELAGGSADEMRGAISGVQSVMTDMITGKGVPSGMGILAKAVGFDVSKARDTFYVMDKLKEFAKSVPADIGNSVLKSFGLSEGVIASFRSAKFRPDTIKDILGEREIKNLDNLNTSWTRFWHTIKLFSERKVSIFGPSVIHELSNALAEVLHLEKGLTSLAKKFPSVGIAGKAAFVLIAASVAPLTSAVAGLLLLLSQLKEYREGKGFLFDIAKQGVTEKGESSIKRPDLIGFDAFNSFLISMSDWFKSNVNLPAMNAIGITPSVKPSVEGKKVQNNNSTVHIHGEAYKEAGRIKDEANRGVLAAAATLQPR
jgi:hypothetical protein